MIDRQSSGSEGEPDAGTPRWVRVSAIVGGVLVLLLLGLLLFGGGQHGPGRHMSAGGELVSQGQPWR